MATIRFPFSHAVQHWSNGSESTQTTVYSGDLKLGYDPVANYSVIDQYFSNHYWVELYFDVPADLYKYTCNAYMRHNFQAVASNRRYSYYEFPSSPQFNYYENTDESFEYSDYRFSPENYKEAYTLFEPNGIASTYPFLINEEVIVRTQINTPESYKVNTVYTYEYTDNGITFDSGNLKVYAKTSRLVTFKNIENYYLEFDAQLVYSILTPVYPVEVYVNNNRDLTVSWETSSSNNRSSTYIYIEDSEIEITDSDSNSISASITGSDSIYVFDTEDISTLSIGRCSVSVTANDNYGNTAVASWEFDLVGETNAPEITNVTQNSYPTITWTSDSQISWEMQISNAQGIVYKSGIVIGSEKTFTVPVLLEDGDYSIEMRCVNTYGVMTAWSSYFLHLEPIKPDAPEGIIVSARTDFGVSVSCSDMVTTGKLLVVRRKDENSTPVVLGEYNGSFVDYLIGLNDYHQYTIRNYEQGYADGEWIDGVVLADGEVIRDADDYSKFIHVWKSEDSIPNYAISEDKSDVLVQCIGRKYPVAELGEWVTSIRSFSGHVSNDDFKELRSMKINSSHVLLQGNEEYMPCYMEFSDAGPYIGGGRMINFNMTRIDGDK